jgi:hypothetical protein
VVLTNKNCLPAPFSLVLQEAEDSEVSKDDATGGTDSPYPEDVDAWELESIGQQLLQEGLKQVGCWLQLSVAIKHLANVVVTCCVCCSVGWELGC